jgi:hypothetical protein
MEHRICTFSEKTLKNFLNKYPLLTLGAMQAGDKLS